MRWGILMCVVACGSVDADDEWAWQISPAPLGPLDRTLLLEQTAPAYAVVGGKVRLRVSNAVPGQVIGVVRSEPGPGTSGFCPRALNGECMEVLQPEIVRLGHADATGSADFEMPLPPRHRPGESRWYQAGAGRKAGPARFTPNLAPPIEVIVQPRPDICDLPEGPVMTFEGADADGEGTSAWNSIGGAEPAASGHNLGLIDPCMSGLSAYHYLASRDYIEPASPGSHLVSMQNLPLTAQALTDGGYDLSQITARTSLMTLQQFTWNPPTEVRTYGGGGAITLSLDGHDLVQSPLDSFEISIFYGPSVCFIGDHQVGATTDSVPLLDVSSGSPASVRAVAQALLTDLQDADTVRYDVLTLQAANQGDFSGQGRNGGHFDVANYNLVPECSP